MQQPKPNNKPFWSLIILLILVIALRSAILIVLSKLSITANVEGVVRNLLLQSIITIIILLGEAIVYRILRARFHKMSWVWLHIILLYFILLILPIFYGVLNFFLPRYLDRFRYSGWMAKIGLGQSILFWSCLLISHLFFVLTIVYGFPKKEVIERANNEPPNLLDEFNE